MSAANFRNRNRMAVDVLKEEGIYNETLRNLVEEMGILSPRAAARDSHFVFQTRQGTQRTPDEIVQRLQRQDFEIGPETADGINVKLGALVDDARPNSKKKGVIEADIKDMVRPNKSMDGWTPQTMGGVNPADPVHRARFLPDEGLQVVNQDTRRAQQIGFAEATGDLEKMYDANTMYDYSLADAEEVGNRVLVGNKTLANFMATKGVEGERAEKLLDPLTGRKVKDMSKEDRKDFFRQRGISQVQRWMNMGGRSIGDGRSEIHVPGFHAQMEHQNKFTGSKDVLGVKGSDYFSDDVLNRAGSLERYENAEKNDIDTVDYHRARRGALLGKDRGLTLSLGKTSEGREAVDTMIAEAIPSVTYSNARWKADREPIISVDDTQTALDLTRLTNMLYAE